MKDIETLTSDIKEVLRNPPAHAAKVSDDAIVALGVSITEHVRKMFYPDERKPREMDVIYPSELGTQCARQLWYKIHNPALAEPLSPNTRMKFLYGNILEDIALFLAQVAGHTVENQQKSVDYRVGPARIKGRMDATIDNHVVDVKSASPMSYNKIVKTGLDDINDGFGYRAQVSAYTEGSGYKHGGILAVDKVNGHVGYREVDYIASDSRVRELQEALNPKEMPDGNYDFVTEVSGNVKLGPQCSYCAFKYSCMSTVNDGKGLRAFAYAGKGPVFYAEVVKEPKVPELKRSEISDE